MYFIWQEGEKWKIIRKKWTPLGKNRYLHCSWFWCTSFIQEYFAVYQIIASDFQFVADFLPFPSFIFITMIIIITSIIRAIIIPVIRFSTQYFPPVLVISHKVKFNELKTIYLFLSRIIHIQTHILNRNIEIIFIFKKVSFYSPRNWIMSKFEDKFHKDKFQMSNIRAFGEKFIFNILIE